MDDFINILPELITNQIAAGEVIQGPFSVVKELLENSIDAKSTEITLNIEDSGKTLIQVLDNGIGMSENDVLMCLKNHSTSKIKKLEDLYFLTTLGFRGEAIASIVSVSQVEIISSNTNSDVGTKIIVDNSEVVSKETLSCKKGTTFIVKNLFYNTPARRAFFKSDELELNYIIREFIRVALANPSIFFKFINNGEVKYELEPSNLLKRITDIFKNKNRNNLIKISSTEPLLNVDGYIMEPYGVRRNDDIYIFVNKRFIVDNGLKKKIIGAYGNLISKDKIPFCVLNIDINPSDIDINISPSKTDIKFKNEQLVYLLIRNLIKKKLFYSSVAELKFDSNDYIDIKDIKLEDFENDYNLDTLSEQSELFDKKSYISDSNCDQEVISNSCFSRDYNNLVIVNGCYIVSPVNSGLILINANRAVRRIEYDNIFKNLSKSEINSQQLLFPNRLFINDLDVDLLKSNQDILKRIGFTFVFDISSVLVIGIPCFLDSNDINTTIDIIISILKDRTIEDIYDEIIKGILRQKNIVNLSGVNEAKTLIDKLFLSEKNVFDPFGKRIYVIVDSSKLDDIIDN